MLRESFFYAVDKIMPRSLARWPYHQAHKSLALKFMNIGFPGEVWIRNSVYEGNFIFGVSDLDVTLFLPQAPTKDGLKKIRNVLAETKQIYPFLGEANCYIKDLSLELLESANHFELQRDPLLVSKLAYQGPHHACDSTVFLLRMLYSDRRKLFQSPALRRKKWAHHFERALGKPLSGELSFDLVVTEIVRSLGLSPQTAEAVEKALQILKHPQLDDYTAMRWEIHDLWKFLYPNRHLWFHKEEALESIKGSMLAKVCIRQLDWEVWGLMGHLPFIRQNQEGFKTHLERLERLAGLLAPEEPTHRNIRSLLNTALPFWD